MKVSENPSVLTDKEIKELAIAEYTKNAKKEAKKQHQFATEFVTLPSRGKVYNENSVLHSGVVEMKYMTAREEDILASPNLIKQGKVIEKLIESLVVTEGFDINELIIGDKNALIVAARILGIGKMYDVKIECSECNKSNPTQIDLAKLPETEFNPDAEYIVAPNEFEFIAPHSKARITFKILTHADEVKINAELEAIKKKSKKDDVSKELSTRTKHMILSINGNYDKAFVNDYVDNILLSMDAKALRKFSGSIAPNIEFKADVNCPSCGYAEEGIDFNLDALTFFWAS